MYHFFLAIVRMCYFKEEIHNSQPEHFGAVHSGPFCGLQVWIASGRASENCGSKSSVLGVLLPARASSWEHLLPEEILL